MEEIVGDVLQDKAVRDKIIVSYLRKTVCFFCKLTRFEHKED